MTNARGAAASDEAGRVLVADDQADVVEALRMLLRLHGFAVQTASSPAAVLAALGAGASPPFDLLVMDLNYARDTTSGREGLELVGRARGLDPHLPIVVMTAWSTVPLAVATMREGVSDFVEKPWDNARLLATVRAQVAAGRERRRAQRLLRDARDVQQRLLASALPEVPGYAVGAASRFAEELGGDTYAVAPLSGRRLGVVIADVCGKGTPAALVMAGVQATLDDLLALSLPPREVCARMGEALRPRLASDRFVSLACVVLDPESGTLTCSNAGHPAPLVVRSSGRIERLEKGGPVLGLLADAAYDEETVALRAGDRLVLFTDGIVEAAAASGEELGEGRLLGRLAALRASSAAEAARALLALAQEFAGREVLADDATVVVVDVA